MLKIAMQQRPHMTVFFDPARFMMTRRKGDMVELPAAKQNMNPCPIGEICFPIMDGKNGGIRRGEASAVRTIHVRWCGVRCELLTK